ncbi:MAG: hypothetical protein LBR53_08495 [Deltaproteobacteria bacterium]|jgi:signal transduction histidine kinase|nr:hypothetical protein [Deltaproteobacteria bacterium]
MPSGDAQTVIEFLTKLILIANSNIQFDSKVDSFLNLLTRELGIDRTVLLFLDREKKHLSPHRRDNAPSDLPSPPVAYLDTFLNRVVVNRQSAIVDALDLTQLPPPWAEFLSPYLSSICVVPITDDKACYGVVMTLSKGSLDHTQKTYGKMLEAVTNQLSLAIKNNQLATDTRKRISVLNVLSELGRTLAATIEVDKVTTMIPRIAAGVFLADGAALNVLDNQGETLLVSSHFGHVPPAYNFQRFQGQTVPAPAFTPLKRQTPFMGYLKDDPLAQDVSLKEQSNTILTVPLMFQGRREGVISLFNKLGGNRGGFPSAPKLFEEGDMELLKAMNSMISGVVENSLSYKDVNTLAKTNEYMVRYLSNLYDISSAMMTTVRYDELVWIIIQSLTLEQGLKFDKVLIMLLRETETDPVLESSAYWAPRDKNRGDESLNELADILRKPNRQEAALMIEEGKKMNISVPVTPDSTRILARAVVERKPLLGCRGTDTSEDHDLLDFGLQGYAAVPMLAKGREVGVIAVDRSLSGDLITRQTLRELNMLTNQAGLAIENTILYDDLRTANQNLAVARNRLIQAEKLAAQGEMGTQLAHEIRNPLVSIGGFTQRLLKKLKDDDPLRRYPQVILEEVERLNKVLNNVLDFSRDEKGQVREFSLEDMAREVLSSLKHELSRNKVTVELAAEDKTPLVSGDDRQIMHVFLNLIYNASQAMNPGGGGKIYIKIFRHKDNETHYVACSITDTGPGIPVDLLPSVFNPFFTTKTQGTGLGLSIVQKIVTRYNGTISVVNHPPEYPGSGASFTFMFPVSTASGAVVY